MTCQVVIEEEAEREFAEAVKFFDERESVGAQLGLADFGGVFARDHGRAECGTWNAQ